MAETGFFESLIPPAVDTDRAVEGVISGALSKKDKVYKFRLPNGTVHKFRPAEGQSLDDAILEIEREFELSSSRGNTFSGALEGIRSGFANVAGLPGEMVGAMRGAGRDIVEPDAPYSPPPFGIQATREAIGAKAVGDLRPGQRPFARATEVIGETLPFIAAPYARLATAPIKKFATEAPARYLGSEMGSAIGAGIGAAGAEYIAPGQPLARMGAEIVGGLTSPLGMALGNLHKVGNMARRGAVPFTEGGKQAKAAEIAQETVGMFGDVPGDVAKTLEAPGVIANAPLTAAQKAGTRGLTLIERKVIKDSDKFGVTVEDQTRKSIEAVNQAWHETTGMDASGLADAARDRQAHWGNVIDARVKAAEEKGQAITEGLQWDTASTRQGANVQARNLIEGARKEARGTERELWGRVPRDVETGTESISDAWDEAYEDLLPGEHPAASRPVLSRIREYLKKVEGPEADIIGDVDDVGALRAARAADMDLIRRLKNPPKVPADGRLMGWLQTKGGLKNDGGELRHIGIDSRSRPGFYNNATGMHLDDAARAAFEQGFFEHRPTVSEFVEALSEDFNNIRPRYHPSYMRELDEIDALGRIDQDFAERGIDINATPDELSARLTEIYGTASVEDVVTPKSGELIRMRSRIGRAIRKIEGGPNPDWDASRRLKILNAGLMDELAGVSVEATDARAFSREFNKKFTHSYAQTVTRGSATGGPRVRPEATLERSVAGSGAEAPVYARELRSAVEPLPGMPGTTRGAEMEQAQRSVVQDMLRRDVMNTNGTINPEKLRRFRTDPHRAELLKDLGLDRMLGDTNQAAELVERRLGMYGHARKVVGQSAAFAKVAKVEKPITAVRNAMQGGNPHSDLGGMFRLARRSPSGRKGARAALFNVWFEDARDQATGLISGEKMLAQMNAPVRLSSGRTVTMLDFAKQQGIVSPDQAKRLNIIADKAGKLETALKSGRDLTSLMQSPDPYFDLFLRWAGANIGGASMLGRTSGASLVMAGHFSREMRRMFEKVPAARVADILSEAALDPQLMARLLRAPTATPRAKARYWKRMHAYLYQVGILDERDRETIDRQVMGMVE